MGMDMQFVLDEIKRIVDFNEEKDYEKAILENNAVNALYYLSPRQGNVVRWLPIRQNMRVLEVGSECGGLTVALAKMAGWVDAIECNAKMCEISKKRTECYSNVRVMQGSLADNEEVFGNNKYDFIIVNHCIEFPGMYIEIDSDMELGEAQNQFITYLMNLLNRDGKLVFLTGNRMALSLWNGKREAYADESFASFSMKYSAEQKRLCTKPELIRVFEKTGLKDVQFYYPYPNERLSMTIYSDKHLPKKGELNQESNSMQGIKLFEESAVFDLLIEDGMFPYFANAFLIVAS